MPPAAEARRNSIVIVIAAPVTAAIPEIVVIVRPMPVPTGKTRPAVIVVMMPAPAPGPAVAVIVIIPIIVVTVIPRSAPTPPVVPVVIIVVMATVTPTAIPEIVVIVIINRPPHPGMGRESVPAFAHVHAEGKGGKPAAAPRGRFRKAHGRIEAIPPLKGPGLRRKREKKSPHRQQKKRLPNHVELLVAAGCGPPAQTCPGGRALRRPRGLA